MEEHKIRFGVDGGHSLIGVLTKPTGQWTNNSQKVVVLVHGAMANKNSFYHKHLAEHLTTELGYHTFRYDALGVGVDSNISNKLKRAIPKHDEWVLGKCQRFEIRV